MKTMLAFWKKEWMDQFRSAKFYILMGVFVLFGIMNPVTAKITPGRSFTRTSPQR